MLPPQQAQGLLGGFPCQAIGLGLPVVLLVALACCLPLNKFISLLVSSQGASKAGAQKGLQDNRANLVKHFWRLWGTCPHQLTL